MVSNAWANGWPITIVQKLRRIHWPVLLTVCVLAVIGATSLYSVSGGSLEPWAGRQYCVFLWR